MSNTPDELPKTTRCAVGDEAHHWVSKGTNMQGIPWVIECSMCGGFNRKEMEEYLQSYLAQHREAVEREARIDEAGNAIASLENSDGASKDLELRLYNRLQTLNRNSSLSCKRRVISDLDKQLESLYAKVRAGKNPDTGELHITQDEFITDLKTLFRDTAKECVPEKNNRPHKMFDSGYTAEATAYADGFDAAVDHFNQNIEEKMK